MPAIILTLIWMSSVTAGENASALAADFAKIAAAPEDNADVLDACVKIEKFLNPSADVEKFRLQFDDMCDSLAAELAAENSGEDKLDAFIDFVEDENFEIRWDMKNCGPRLAELFDNGSGNYVTMAALFYVLGNRIGLPIYVSSAPQDIFLRYDDGQIERNMDLPHCYTSTGNASYRLRWKLDASMLGPGKYLANFTKKEIIGLFLLDACYGNPECRPTPEIAPVIFALLPDFPDAHYLIGDSYLKSGDATRAKELLAKAAPVIPDAAISLAEILIDENKFAEAIAAAGKFADDERFGGSVNAILAEAYLGAGDLEKAENACQKAADAGAVDAETLAAVANALTGANKNETAMMLFEMAVGARPDDYNLRDDFGRWLVKRGEFEAAADAFNEAIRIEPSAAFLHSSLADAFASLGKHQEALEKYRRAARLMPKAASARFSAGEMLEKLFLPEEALRSFDEAYKLEPKTKQYLYALAGAYLDFGNYSEAQELLGTLASDEEGLAESATFMGRLRFEKTEYGEAARFFEFALKSKEALTGAELAAVAVYFCSVKKDADAREAIFEMKKKPSGAHTILAAFCVTAFIENESSATLDLRKYLKSGAMNPLETALVRFCAGDMYSQELLKFAEENVKEESRKAFLSATYFYVGVKFSASGEKEIRAKGEEFLKKCRALGPSGAPEYWMSGAILKRLGLLDRGSF